MSTNTFIGTKLTAEDYRKFSIIAAERGKSRSALLKSLADDLIASERESSTPARKTTNRRKAA